MTSYFKQLTKDKMEVVDERGFIGNSKASIKSAKTLSTLSSAVMSVIIDLTDDLDFDDVEFIGGLSYHNRIMYRRRKTKKSVDPCARTYH